MIKRLLTATTILLLACSCNSSSELKSWRDENRLPNDVYRVEEVSVVNNPFGNDHKHTSRTVYSLDELGRTEYVTTNSQRTDYYYAGKGLLLDSCVYSDGSKMIFKYSGDKCIELITVDRNGDVSSDVHVTSHTRKGLPIDSSTDGWTTHMEYDNDGRMVSMSLSHNGEVYSKMIYEYNSHGDRISERETAPNALIDSSTNVDYDYDYEGDYWVTQRKYKVYDSGDRDLRLLTTRKIFRK